MARIRTVLTTVVLTTAAVGLSAAPAGAARRPPVKVGGTVNNKGVAKVSGGTVSIDADSFSFDRTFLKAKPGDVAVTVRNTSGIPHTFTVDGQDVDVQLAPGASKTVTVAVSSGPPVVFYCRFHRASGMQGAFFTAKSGESTASNGRPSGAGSSYGY